MRRGGITIIIMDKLEKMELWLLGAFRQAHWDLEDLQRKAISSNTDVSEQARKDQRIKKAEINQLNRALNYLDELKEK